MQNFPIPNKFLSALLIFFLAISVSQTSVASPQKIEREQWVKLSALTMAGLVALPIFATIATPNCFWCQTNAFDTSISEALRVENLDRASLFSDIFTIGSALTFAGLSQIFDQFNGSVFLRDGLIILSSVLNSLAVAEAVKISARRTRPQVEFSFAEEDFQSNRSFLSGHTTLAFAALTSASYLVFLKNKRAAPYFMGAAALAALGVGCSRIAAQKHYFTDVAAGMALGIASGLFFPWFVLPSKKDSVAKNFYLAPSLSGGITLGMFW